MIISSSIQHYSDILKTNKDKFKVLSLLYETDPISFNDYVPNEVEYKYLIEINNLLNYNINNSNFINILMLANYFGYEDYYMNILIHNLCIFLNSTNIKITTTNLPIQDLRLLIYNNPNYMLQKDLSYITYDDFKCMDINLPYKWSEDINLNLSSIIENPDIRVLKYMFTSNCQFIWYDYNVIISVIQKCITLNAWEYLYYLLQYDGILDSIIYFRNINELKTLLIQIPFYMYDIIYKKTYDLSEFDNE